MIDIIKCTLYFIVTSDHSGAALSQPELEHAASPDVPPDLARVLEDDEPGGGDQAGAGQVAAPAGGHWPQTRPALRPAPRLRLRL